MATPLKSISEIKTEPSSIHIEDAAPATDTQQEKPKKKCRRNKEAGNKKEPGATIGAKSPTVYLLKEEKTFLDRLKAFILLKTGEKSSDHVLVFKALQEYASKHYKDFEQELS